ncbi:MAG: hypothetical protein M3Z41_06820 [Candidatus Eremiobacteraeota bacterium]|nr:hypothetical protein [Candidatus Eremiobacteraeota bacterium]
MEATPAGFRAPTQHWEVILSSFPSQAVGWNGYFPGYYHGATGPFGAIPFALLTAMGLAMALCSLGTRWLAALMLVGLSIIIGFKSPWTGFERHMFEAVPMLAAFREFYHAAPLVSFPASVLGAMAFDILKPLTRRVAAIVAVGLLLGIALAAAPWHVPFFDGETVVDEVGIGVKGQNGGIASSPMLHPVGIPPHYGLDPTAWSRPDLPVFWMYEPTQPALAAGTALQCGDASLQAMFSQMGIGAVLVHGSWRSAAAADAAVPLSHVDPCLRSSAHVLETGDTRDYRTDRLIVLPPSSNGVWIKGHLPLTTRLDERCDSGLPADFLDAAGLSEPLALDPSSAWVPARPFYLEHREFAFAPANGVYTRSDRRLALHNTPGHLWLLMWNESSVGVNAGGGFYTLPRHERLTWVPIDATREITLSPMGATALFGWVSRRPLPQSHKRCRSYPVHWNRFNATRWLADVDLPGSVTIVFRQSFDPGWELLLNGHPVAQHMVVDGYANGWYVSETYRGSAEVVFRPQQGLDRWLVVSALAWGFGIIFALPIGRYATKDGGKNQK